MVRRSGRRIGASVLAGAILLAHGAVRAEPWQQTVTFSDAAGGERSFLVVLPVGYDPNDRNALVIVFAGTDTTGQEMHDWLGRGWTGAPGLESAMLTTIFVYPDQKYRWDGDGGWRLGPEAGAFGGDEDIAFTDELLDHLESHYAIDSERVFATGHSWGGDMAAVAGCFLGDRFRAIAPIAANRPYWFGTPPDPSICRGDPAVWTIFGLADDHFGDESPDGLFGEEQNDFWRLRQSCSQDYTQSGETLDFKGCATGVRLTLYAAGQYGGGGDLVDHQPPDWLPKALGGWFMGL